MGRRRLRPPADPPGPDLRPARQPAGPDPGRPRTGPGDPLPRPRSAMTAAIPPVWARSRARPSRPGRPRRAGPGLTALAGPGWLAGARRRAGLTGPADRRAARSGIRPVNGA